MKYPCRHLKCLQGFIFLIMISLSIDKNYIPDLRDDVFGNYDKNLYQFVGNDPVRAFYFGMYIAKWFGDLDQQRQLLYSKQLRHVSDGLSKYEAQVGFWASKFSKDEEINMIEFSEYLLNNMFYDKEFDIINLALFLGNKTEIKNEDV